MMQIYHSYDTCHNFMKNSYGPWQVPKRDKTAMAQHSISVLRPSHF